LLFYLEPVERELGIPRGSANLLAERNFSTAKMKQLSQAGLTAFEMLIAIIVLTILLGTGIAVYSAIITQAKLHSTESAAAALTAAAAGNYMLKRTGTTYSTVTNCTDVSGLLPTGSQMPTGYTITSQTIVADTKVSCTLTHSDGTTTANFIGIGA